MSERARQTHYFERPITFHAAGGRRLPAETREITVVFVDGEPTEVRLTFVVAPEVYREIDRQALFHLDPDVRGPGAEGFEATGPVQVEARLDRALVFGLVDEESHAEEAAESLAEAANDDPDDPLLDVESWYALHVTRKVELPPELADAGRLLEGYSTAWATEGDGDLLGQLAEYFEDAGWEFERDPEAPLLRLTHESEHGELACFALVHEEFRQVAFYTLAPRYAPAERIPAVAEFLHRANFGLLHGAFELDVEDGEVRFRTGLDLDDAELTDGLIRGLIEPNPRVLEHYLPALHQVMDGALTPAEAIAMAEDEDEIDVED